MSKRATSPDMPPKASPKRLKAFDINLLRRYTFEDTALERELIGLFQAQLPMLVDQIETARDQSEWHMAAHTLKGSARSVGGPALAELAVELEQLGLQVDPQRARLLKRLKTAVASFMRAAERTYGA